MAGSQARQRAGRHQVDGGGVRVKNMQGVVMVFAEVGTVLNHKFGVRGHGTGVLLHGGVQLENIILQDGILEHARLDARLGG